MSRNYKKYKSVQIGADTIKKILDGADITANAIRQTLGPLGGYFAIKGDTENAITFTKDGATVAESINRLQNPDHDIGRSFITNASKQMSEQVGDGSTTVTAILYEMMKAVTKKLNAGHPARVIQKAIKLVENKAIDILRKIRKNISSNEDIKKIALISSNYDADIADLISQAYDKLNKNGIVICEESRSGSNRLDIRKGFYFNKTNISPSWFKPGDESTHGRIEMTDVSILITDFKIYPDVIREIFNIQQKTGKQILIVSSAGADEQLMQTACHLRTSGTTNLIIFKPPGFGDTILDNLVDLSIATGGETILSRGNNQFPNISEIKFGTAKKVIIGRDYLTIVDGDSNKDMLHARINDIDGKLQNKQLSNWDADNLQQRKARLLSGIACIYVGKKTESETKELKYRVEDAIKASTAAYVGGILPGGGTDALLTLIELEKEKDILVRSCQSDCTMNREIDLYELGLSIFKDALNAPIKHILLNAGQDDASAVIEKINLNLRNDGSQDYGYDVISNEFVNMFEKGIIAPALILENAIYISSSASCVFAALKGSISETNEESNAFGDSPI